MAEKQITLEDGTPTTTSGWKALQRDGRTFWSKKIEGKYVVVTSWTAFNLGIEAANGGDPFRVAKAPAGKRYESASSADAWKDGGKKNRLTGVSHPPLAKATAKPSAPPKKKVSGPGMASVLSKRAKQLMKKS